MFSCFEGDQGLIEALGLPVGRLRSGVTGDAVDEFVMSPIVAGLISVLLADAGRINQCEAEGLVVGLVGTVLAIGENGGAELAGFVGQVDPLMGGDFEFSLIVVGAANSPDVPVVGGFGVRGGQREGGFQGGFADFPVDGVGDFDAIAGVAGGEADGLDEFGAFG